MTIPPDSTLNSLPYSASNELPFLINKVPPLFTIILAPGFRSTMAKLLGESSPNSKELLFSIVIEPHIDKLHVEPETGLIPPCVGQLAFTYK